MSAIVHCPECHRALQVPDEFFGQKVQCPDCKQKFVANPAAGEAPAAGAIQIAPASGLPPAPVPAPMRVEPDRNEPEPDYAASRRRERDDDRDDLDDVRGDDLHTGEPERGAIILTLGIISLVLSFFSFMLYILPIWIAPLTLGIIGWIMGHRDLRAIRALGRRNQSNNYVLTLIGMILSIVGLGISICVMLFSCGMIALLVGIFTLGAANAPPPGRPRPR
jgi:hypothetical protein